MIYWWWIRCGHQVPELGLAFELHKGLANRRLRFAALGQDINFIVQSPRVYPRRHICSPSRMPMQPPIVYDHYVVSHPLRTTHSACLLPSVDPRTSPPSPIAWGCAFVATIRIFNQWQECMKTVKNSDEPAEWSDCREFKEDADRCGVRMSQLMLRAALADQWF